MEKAKAKAEEKAKVRKGRLRDGGLIEPEG